MTRPVTARRLRRFGTPLAVVAGAVLMSGCAKNETQSIFTPKGDNARKIDDLQRFPMYAAIVVGVVVFSFLGFAVWKFKDRGQALPGQGHGNSIIELGTVAVSAVLLGVIAEASAAEPLLESLLVLSEDENTELDDVLTESLASLGEPGMRALGRALQECRRQASIISSESVATITSSRREQARTALWTHVTSGRPAISRSILRGRRVDPSRAGITAITFMGASFGLLRPGRNWGKPVAGRWLLAVGHRKSKRRRWSSVVGRRQGKDRRGSSAVGKSKTLRAYGGRRPGKPHTAVQSPACALQAPC